MTDPLRILLLEHSAMDVELSVAELQGGRFRRGWRAQAPDAFNATEERYLVPPLRHATESHSHRRRR